MSGRGRPPIKATLFGQELRRLRQAKGETSDQLSRALGISKPYLSGLETGQRGAPSERLFHLICQHFGIIWDEADTLRLLADLSNPSVRIETKPDQELQRTFLHLLGKHLDEVPTDDVKAWFKVLLEKTDASLPQRAVSELGLAKPVSSLS